MMPTHSGAEPLPKVEKLNAVNHLAWFANMEHMLKLKNCWAAVDEDAPPRVVRIMQKEERIMQKEERIPSRAELGAVIAGNPTTKAGKAAKPKARAQLATLDRQRMDEVAMATMHLYVEPVHHVAFRVCTTAREAWGKLQYELGQLGQGLPEGDLVAAILGRLPAAYDTTVELLSDQETLTMAKVTDRLMATE
eukprot:contig_5889_g1329